MDPVSEFMDSVDAEVTEAISDAYLRYTNVLADRLTPEEFVIRMTDWTEVSEQLAGEINETLEDLVARAGQRFWMGPTTTAFSIQNPYTPKWLTEHAFTRVSEIQSVNAAALGSLRNRMAEGVLAGETRRELSKYIKSTIGLAPRDVTAVERVRQVDGLEAAERYARVKLNERARRIARTELVSASNHGANASWAVARDEGYIPNRSQKRWIAGRDERMCPVCGVMDGKRVGLNERFLLPDGQQIDGPTAHPNCRCSIALVTDLSKNWKPPPESFTVGGFITKRQRRVAEHAKVAARVRSQVRQHRQG